MTETTAPAADIIVASPACVVIRTAPFATYAEVREFLAAEVEPQFGRFVLAASDHYGWQVWLPADDPWGTGR